MQANENKSIWSVCLYPWMKQAGLLCALNIQRLDFTLFCEKCTFYLWTHENKKPNSARTITRGKKQEQVRKKRESVELQIPGPTLRPRKVAFLAPSFLVTVKLQV